MAKNLLEKTYDEWYRHYPHAEADKRVSPYLDWPEQSEEGWLRMIRKSLFLSTTTVAKRMGVSSSAYSRLERAEVGGQITLKKMREMADAMECEVIYVIRPKKRMPFSKMVWLQIEDALKKHKNFREDGKNLRMASYLSFLARWTVEKSNFRSKHGWTLRKGYSGFRDGVRM